MDDLMIEEYERPKKKKGDFSSGKELVKLLVFIMRTFTCFCIAGFSAILLSFFLSIAFPSNVQQAVEIFFNIFKNIL